MTHLALVWKTEYAGHTVDLEGRVLGGKTLWHCGPRESIRMEAMFVQDTTYRRHNRESLLETSVVSTQCGCSGVDTSCSKCPQWDNAPSVHNVVGGSSSSSHLPFPISSLTHPSTRQTKGLWEEQLALVLLLVLIRGVFLIIRINLVLVLVIIFKFLLLEFLPIYPVQGWLSGVYYSGTWRNFCGTHIKRVRGAQLHKNNKAVLVLDIVLFLVLVDHCSSIPAYVHTQCSARFMAWGVGYIV